MGNAGQSRPIHCQWSDSLRKPRREDLLDNSVAGMMAPTEWKRREDEVCPNDQEVGLCPDGHAGQEDGVCFTDVVQDDEICSNDLVQEDGVLHYGRWADLPEDVAAIILSMAAPKAVARLACVSKECRDLSNLNLVWQKILSSCYADTLPQPEITTSRSKELFEHLCNRRFLLENATQDFWLDRATGGVCRSVGACGFSHVRGWRNGRELPLQQLWGTREGSRFAQTAVCPLGSLEMQGHLKCFWPRGTYTLAWRLCFLKDAAFGLAHPASFSFKAVENKKVDTKVVFYGLTAAPEDRDIWMEGEEVAPEEWMRTETRDYIQLSDNNNWMEIAAGEFVVKRDDVPMEINFSMTKPMGTGMYVDGVVIRPTAARATYYPKQPGALLFWYRMKLVDGRLWRCHSI